MLPVPRVNIEDSSILDLHCAICGKAALSAVHLDQFPDYVSCANCSAAFVMEADGDRVMYGSIPVDYPETSRFALQQWTWLEAIERRAKPERPPEAAPGVPPGAGETDLPPRDASPTEELEDLPEPAVLESDGFESAEAPSAIEPRAADSMEPTDLKDEPTIEPIRSETEGQTGSETGEAIDTELAEASAEAIEPGELTTREEVDSGLSPIASDPSMEADPQPDGIEQEPEATPETAATPDSELFQDRQADLDPDLAPPVADGMEEPREGVLSGMDAEIQPPAFGTEFEPSPIPPSEGQIRPSEIEGSGSEYTHPEAEFPEQADAIFSDDWLDGMVETPEGDVDEESAAVELTPEEETEAGTGVPLQLDPGEVEPARLELDGGQEPELDPTAWLEEYAEPEADWDQPALDSTSPFGEMEAGFFPEEGGKTDDDSEPGQETPPIRDSIPKTDAVVIGGIEVTEDFEDYAGVLPFEETSGALAHVQVDGVTAEEKDRPADRADLRTDEKPFEAERAVPGTEQVESQVTTTDGSDPPEGIRHRVVLRSPRANIPFGICAHCMRSPATNELIILDPWIAPDAQQKERGYTLFLCPSCFQRARSPSDEQRNARITAYLISAVVALTVIVFAVIIGLVNFRENPLVDAVILTILGLIGFVVPAVILLNRSNRYPPSADAAYVRSTLYIPPREDETEVVFEWRNKDFAARFAESNYEILLGDVSEVSDQAPGLRDAE